MSDFKNSAFEGYIGTSQVDITPPLGIYARNWGAADHDVAGGVHRPLLLTCMAFKTDSGTHPMVLIGADFGVWRSAADGRAIRSAILEEFSLPAGCLMFCLTHNHAGPVLSRDESSKPGGQYIDAYLIDVRNLAINAVRQALDSCVPSVMTWGYGKCNLATNRDFRNPDSDAFLAGFNPDAEADDTLLVGRATDMQGNMLATLVNYACHPTTLGWQNELLSPDYAGAMRETVTEHTQAPCLFLQGASGNLAPREQYVADVEIADKHGRQLAYAVLAALESLLPPKTALAFEGVVKSGADLAIWGRKAVSVSNALQAETVDVVYDLKPLPSLRELEAQYSSCQDRVERERLWRKLSIRKNLGDGDHVPVPLWVWQIGDAVLVGQPNEAYVDLQLKVRADFYPHTVAVINLVNGSAGYLPPQTDYDRDLYPVLQTPFAPGSLERLQDAVTRTVKQILSNSN
ncbi:hypothetical protein [Parapedobacter sp. 10938]|uniref:hypothetical protein n=1 Tax=Parapedobacter flavus TaxID=3110225 RepID=UPI002DBD3D04|nr:hypothetical protein [Parapedobacter sp. 10938]MEC3878454.1 hypothetical protein [Parapedobacter sp. 10938]